MMSDDRTARPKRRTRKQNTRIVEVQGKPYKVKLLFKGDAERGIPDRTGDFTVIESTLKVPIVYTIERKTSGSGDDD
jgi:hypothetical protein